MSSSGASGAGGGPGDSGNGDRRREPGKSGGKVKAKRDYRKGVTKRKYDDELKNKIVTEMEKGARNSEICRMYNVPESTVRTMRKQQSELKANLALAKKYFEPGAGSSRRVKTVTEYSSVMLVVEHYLLQWLNRRTREGISVSGPEIQDQARLFYDAVAKKRNIASPPEFTASRGWLQRFKGRAKVKHVSYHGEAQSADVEAAASFPPVAEKMIEDGNYTLAQVYNCDETGVYWKRSPRSTYIAMSERQAKGVKMAKDRFTALLTANAMGTHRMRPLILYHSKRPRAYKHANMENLQGYIWKANSKGYMTSTISLEWFDNHFVPDAQAFCEENNLAFRVLLFMDNAPGHARFLVGRHPAVQVVFLPPNTTSKIQPMDQEVIANTKLLFYQDIHNRLRAATDTLQELLEIQGSESPRPSTSTGATEDSDIESEPDDPVPSSSTTPNSTISAKVFWKNLNICQAVEAFVRAWKSLSVLTLTHAWKPLLPNLVTSQPGREERQQLLEETVETIRRIPVPGFADVTQQEVEDLISHAPPQESIEEMLDEEIMEVEQQTAQEPQEEVEKVATTSFLSRSIITCELFAEETEPLTFIHKEKVLENIKSIISLLGEVFNQRIQEGQQALITRYLHPRPQEAREVEVPVRAEGSSEHGNPPDPEAVANLMLDEEFSGFVEEQEGQASGEMDHRVNVLRQMAQKERSGGGGDDGSGGAH